LSACGEAKCDETENEETPRKVKLCEERRHGREFYHE